MFHEKLATMRTKSEIDISNLRKNLSDRDKTIQLKTLEVTRLKDHFVGTLSDREGQITLLRSSLTEAQIELHNQKCILNNNDGYKEKYESLLEQMRLERATVAEYVQEKTILADQNNKLSQDHGFESQNSSNYSSQS